MSTYKNLNTKQLKEGIIESAPETPKGRVFYIPNKPLVREAAETTKVRIVYDASVTAYPEATSLNNILYAGPPPGSVKMTATTYVSTGVQTTISEWKCIGFNGSYLA